MFVQQHCFQKSLHLMMTLGSGMVSGLKHHIYTLKSAYLGSKLFFKASFIKDNRILFVYYF